VQHYSSQSDCSWPSLVCSIRDTGNRVRPGTCLVCGVCGLAGIPSNENASENPYNRGLRDAGRSAGDNGRDGLRSPDRPLYRLRYPAHVYKTLLHKLICCNFANMYRLHHNCPFVLLRQVPQYFETCGAHTACVDTECIRDHLEEVKSPTSKEINFPVRHQLRIDSGSHHTHHLIENAKFLSKLKRPELEGTLLQSFSDTNLIQLYVTTSVLRKKYLVTVPVTFRRLHGMGDQHISPQILNL